MKSFSFENIILFLAGAAITVIVSFIFFRLQEARATTAHKERVDRANSEAMRSYVKLLLQLDDGLGADDLRCIDFSVAKEFNIEREELSTSRTIFDTSVGLILQSDFIRREEKETLLKSERLPQLRAALTESARPSDLVTSSDASFNVAMSLSMVFSSILSLSLGYFAYHNIDVKSLLQTVTIALATLFLFLFFLIVIAFMLDEYWLSKIMSRTKDRTSTNTKSREQILSERPRRVKKEAGLNIVDANTRNGDEGRA